MSQESKTFLHGQAFSSVSELSGRLSTHLIYFVYPFLGQPGKSLLHDAAALGLHHLAAQFVSKGLDVDDVDPENGWTPVHYACHNGSVAGAVLVQTPERTPTKSVKEVGNNGRYSATSID